MAVAKTKPKSPVEDENPPVEETLPAVVEGPPRTVALPVSVDEALRQWRDYQRLTHELLDDSDYQDIGQKKFKKKSAWRKYGRAFNLTTHVSYEQIERDPTGFPVFARIRVVATAPNGRQEEADHECHVTERCCNVRCYRNHYHRQTRCPDDCDGKRHWSHPGDLPATALTRAKNRAISDTIGAGEVSAEEMEGHGEANSRDPTTPPTNPPAPQGKPPPSATQPKYAFTKSHQELKDLIAAYIKKNKYTPDYEAKILIKVTAWTDRDGVNHPGVSEWDKVTEKMATWGIKRFKEKLAEAEAKKKASGQSAQQPAARG